MTTLSIHPRFAERAHAPRYTFPDASRLVDRPSPTLRRWALGNRRVYQDRPTVDEPLIQIDGSSERGELPLSFLNLIELRFLASYRQQVSLPAIRRALEYAAGRLGVKRPLLDLRFATEGRELFLEFAEGEGERYFVNASRSGQLAMAWPEDATRLLRSLDYDDDEHAAFRWWPLGREQPVMLDTRLNAGQPSTAHTAVRTIAIAVRKRQGWTDAAIAEDVSVEPAEIEAALTLERAA